MVHNRTQAVGDTYSMTPSYSDYWCMALCMIAIGVVIICAFIWIILIWCLRRERTVVTRPRQDIRTQAEAGDSEHGLLCLGFVQ